MDRKTQLLTTLEQFEPFNAISDAGRARMRRELHGADFPETTSVLHKGQRVSGAYVVASGCLRVFTVSPRGEEATLYMIRPGETCVFALNCIFNDLLYPAWVEASPGTSVIVIPGALYRALFDAEAPVRNMTVHAFSTLVFRLMAELEQNHFCTLEQRLANFLLMHAGNDGTVRMTQQEIAAHLGTTREVIARVLRGFVARRDVETHRHRIAIRDPVDLAVRFTATTFVPDH